MNRTQLCIVCAAAVLAVGAVAPVGGVQPEGPEVCDNGQTVEAVTPAGTTFETDSPLSLYKGSEVVILYCDSGSTTPPSEWGLEDGDGYEIENERYQVSTETSGVLITFTATREVRMNEYVEPEVTNELVLSPPESAESDVTENDVLTESVQFRNQTTAQEFTQAVDNLSRDVNALNENIRELNATIKKYDNETMGAEEFINTTIVLLEEIENTREDVQNSSYTAKTILHDRAMIYRNNEQTIDTMAEIESEQQMLDKKINQTVNQSAESLASIRGDATSTVRRNVLIGSGIAAFLGFLAGFIQPYRKGKEVNDFYQVSSKNEFTSEVLQWPWIIGFVLLISGVGVLVLTGIFEVII
jgi:hypothetical protein